MQKHTSLAKKLAITFGIVAACFAAPYIEEAAVSLSVKADSNSAFSNRTQTFRECDSTNVQPHLVAGILDERWANRYGVLPFESMQKKAAALHREARIEKARANGETALCSVNDIIPFNGGIEDFFQP